MNNVNYHAMGQRMRIERERLGLSREKFAEIVELSPLYIGQLERGERKMSIDTLIKISNSLHISTDYLIFGTSMDITTPYNDNNLTTLLNRCSKKQLSLIEDIIKLLLPHTCE
ncbi:putative HTH-type transcriptional regulator type 3 [Gottschalkia purinilytica]|uniref:Putative HTH-type transcriptional regulator type 3 n=1 Tax=Gottschalkia purinilytica TaxID=1503 RepID=A0A0L0W949_GOTPU|nr:helix-turn-helix transcriptional regulator [Gottschalkia purinilytica]KNF07845.1 putative HTH-type transcriptional regulator type 3 [Gottschalkia purinilytica]